MQSISEHCDPVVLAKIHVNIVMCGRYQSISTLWSLLELVGFVMTVPIRIPLNSVIRSLLEPKGSVIVQRSLPERVEFVT